MKLEKLFKVENKELYTMDGQKYPLQGKALSVKWSDVEGSPEEYNEEFLAKLRDNLKSLEEKKEFVFIEPLFDKDGSKEGFTAAMKHTARRIKDCTSVIGFALPEEILEEKDFYIEELSAKHAHYCFFCKKDLGNDIVLY